MNQDQGQFSSFTGTGGILIQGFWKKERNLQRHNGLPVTQGNLLAFDILAMRDILTMEPNFNDSFDPRTLQERFLKGKERRIENIVDAFLRQYLKPSNFNML